MNLAVLDACVLYRPALRDLLMWLASVEAYAPRWTEHIHDEWIRNVLKDNPGISRSQIERTRRLMDTVNPESLVLGYENLMTTLHLPDPNDRHVLAAAIQANAPHIVTLNLSDFPDFALMPYHVRAVHPDYFLSALFDDNPDVFLQGVREHRAELRNPPKTAQDYISTLRTGNLHQLAIRLEAHRDVI